MIPIRLTSMCNSYNETLNTEKVIGVIYLKTKRYFYWAVNRLILYKTLENKKITME